MSEILPSLTKREIFYANSQTPMAAEVISAARATSVGDAIEPILETSGIHVASDKERDELFPQPAQGDVVYRTDFGIEQRYFELFSNKKNHGGRTPAGWYATKNVFVPIISNVSLSLINNVTIENVFQPTFKDYFILGNIDSNINTNLYMRLGFRGVLYTGGLMQRVRMGGENSGTLATNSSNAVNDFYLSVSTNAGTNRHMFTATLSNPYQFKPTKLINQHGSVLLTTLAVAGNSAGWLQENNTFTDFHIYATGGALMTGTISIYGMN